VLHLTNTYFIAYQSHADETHENLTAVLQIIVIVRIIITYHPLLCPTSNITYIQIWQKRRTQFPTYYSVTRNSLYTKHRIVCSLSWCTFLLKITQVLSLLKNGVKKMCTILVLIYVLSKKKMGIIFLAALITHHTPTLTTPMVLHLLTWSFLQTNYLLFWEFMQ